MKLQENYHNIPLDIVAGMEGHWVSNHSHVCYTDPLETVCAWKDRCSMKGMLLPMFFEASWPDWVRIVLYLTGIIYSFLGIFMVADGMIPLYI